MPSAWLVSIRWRWDQSLRSDPRLARKVIRALSGLSGPRGALTRLLREQDENLRELAAQQLRDTASSPRGRAPE